MATTSPLLTVLTAWCRGRGLPDPEPEYEFHPARKWRWDICFPERMVAVEIDGGLYVQGRHSRGAEREKDMEKHAEGICLGWRLLVVSPRMVNDGRLLAWLERLLDA
jgi:very-short-patch-repair endonuclease